MGFTEIILWIIAIVIVLVLADAIRKILLEKRSNLKVKIDPRFRERRNAGQQHFGQAPLKAP